MEKLKKVIERYGRWSDLTIYTDRIEAHASTDFSHSIENAKALLETIGKEICNSKGIEIEGDKVSKTQIINIVGELVEPEAETHPVFVVDMFKELSPLAKEKKDSPGIVERFELYMGGMEIANAYSELNDPIEQEKRFKEQLVGQEGVKKIDQDFVRALEYGMPPAGGLGIGIDRLVMLLANQPSIRDVILFPQLMNNIISRNISMSNYIFDHNIYNHHFQ